MAAVVVFGSIPPAMADSEGDKSYKRHWAIPIGTSTGSLEITDNADRNGLKKQIMSLDEVAASHTGIHMARLGGGINDDDKYYLVWNLFRYSHDAESDAKIKTIHVLDAGTGEPLIDPITKEGSPWGAGAGHNLNLLEKIMVPVIKND